MNQYIRLVLNVLGMAVIFTACKKDNDAGNKQGAVTIGLYQYQSGSYKRIFLPLTKVGTQAVNYYTIFDTGSAGLTLDAQGILPASMITADGIQVTGDSVVVNGITVTSKTSVMSYGDATGLFKEYGNLAYTTLTLGDANGNITTQRIPFFLYYKLVKVSTNETMPAHSADIFGVAPGFSYASQLIQSPLSYLDVGSNNKKGFRLALLKRDRFTTAGSYVGGLLTIGLAPADLLPTAGFIMHPMQYTARSGYSPNIPATITYNGTSTQAQVLFDTGNPMQTIIENQLETNALGNLPVNSVVNVTTNMGFSYTYTTTGSSNFTLIQNPNNSDDYRSIFSIDFFVENEYLTNYTDHQTGLKND
ncbi:hypothetical protein [Mucilaginibacter phyllosphaerae]|uniref:Uncharacterized protein n=1 Tax=Mucilaginibacter phyllosphaerae TaxID=1812349 RepID=A0A4Y8A9A8_9SPHI|nr:hypothetical protein [Mucilaginibacter phyllosphaerae]MBB3969673.1 hypothetical protein [Mucilaginibacter phyllosphaerae]TEW65057.1 hypothetical protein E2R65_14165 [Mucilaginibacter phyllosphaerae]GGH18249.1 hypothetical protein GCM10007352_28840 [Mucilaginibacter phyllosphaerae]